MNDAMEPNKVDSSLSRMMAVLDLFGEQRLTLTPEFVAEALSVSLP